jgi:hypothetical protein
MLDFVPSFLRAQPTPPALRSPVALYAPEPLMLSEQMRADDDLPNDVDTAAALDRFDRLFASL